MNGTSALHISLKLIDTQPGDLVIMPNLTFVATANAVAYNNANPIFLDVDLEVKAGALEFIFNIFS